MEVRESSLVTFKVDIAAPEHLFREFSISEIHLSESLMSPSLHASVMVTSYRHNGYVKNWDLLAGSKINISVNRPILAEYNRESKLDVEMTIYRVENRHPRSPQNDDFKIADIDETALNNAMKRVSKSWKCTPPHAIVGDVMMNCLDVPNLVTEASQPNRTYFAEDIHPYQVVAQQADVALAGGNDPSFLHYMTFEKVVGTHRFESLYGMTRKESIWDYEFIEKGRIDETWENPWAMLSYENPCDFDLLSDALNGINPFTGDINRSIVVVNAVNGMVDIVGANPGDCGIGSAGNDVSFTNKYSAGNENNCEVDVEKHKLLRIARLGLLDSDKIAFRLTVAFNPILHVGKMIKIQTPNKVYNPDGTITVSPDYASGYYLISNMTHKLLPGGFCTTTMDCVSQSVGLGGRTLG